MDLDALHRINTKSINRAGARYTPGIDNTAPNLEIKELEFAIEGLACSQTFRNRAIELHDQLNKAWNDIRQFSSSYLHSLRRPSRLLKELVSLSQCLPGAGRNTVLRGRAAVRSLDAAIKRLSNVLYEAQEKQRRELAKIRSESPTEVHSVDSISEELNNCIHEKQKYESITSEVANFLNSPACDLQFTNAALLLGVWGTGKTHFLCDLTARRRKSNIPSLLVLAKDFSVDKGVGESLAQYTGLANNFRELAEALNNLGRACGERAILMIDGVNESDHEAWRNGVSTLLAAIKDLPFMAIIFSCRQPFESMIFQAGDIRLLVKLLHKGFEEIEFDAQTEFFRYYNVPLPEIPLLAEEFSRPLTLKIMCEAFRALPSKDQKKGFAGVASGQRGMTFVLERFVIKRTEQIEVDLKLPHKFCWTIIKGDDSISDLAVSGIAPCMASTLNEYVSKEQCMKIIRARKQTEKYTIAKKLFQSLVQEGLIVEDIVWQSDEMGGPQKVIRLPYQRFSDHIIARSLLKQLDTSSVSSIKKGLNVAPLNRLFDFIQPNYPQFRHAGWVEALIVEFPERTKKVLPRSRRELFYYLPGPAMDLNAYYKPFVGGLFWRSGDSISAQTDKIVGEYFWINDVFSVRDMMEAMVAVSTKTDHPYSASRLYINLSNIALPARDRHWSEFLRTRSRSGTVERLIRWFETRIPNRLSADSARNHIVLLSLILTTTDRTLRDRVTNTLVRLGELFPSVIFSHAEKSLRFNDPYVPERMLAASYGVAMSLSDELKTDRYKKALSRFARVLTKEMFCPIGRHQTTHTLMLGYSLGIIELARQINLQCIPATQLKYLVPPLEEIADPFPAQKNISDAGCMDAKNAIGMDFGNYTIGRLVPGRGNYQDDHPGYKKMRRRIEWRIANLGYRSKDFKEIDNAIHYNNWNRTGSQDGKIDRYGKKYSWIAYFEMYGHLERKGRVPFRRKWERCSDCDIDPSFPAQPKQIHFQANPLFTSPYADPVSWIRDGPTPKYEEWLEPFSVDGIAGPWVLLSGYVKESSSLDPRKVYTFLRSLLALPKAVRRVQAEFITGTEDRVPDAGEDNYTFGGEVPWSARYGSYLRNRRGNAKRHLEEMYSRYEAKQSTQFTRVEASQDDPIERLELEIPEYVSIPGIAVEVPFHRLSWEAYHSALNQVSGVHLPAPALCETLGLRRKGREWDFYDSKGKLATLLRQFKVGSTTEESYLLYLRTDLLDHYLSLTGQQLFWMLWGERGFHYEELDKISGLLRDEWQKRSHIHRKLIPR